MYGLTQENFDALILAREYYLRFGETPGPRCIFGPRSYQSRFALTKFRAEMMHCGLSVANRYIADQYQRKRCNETETARR